MLRILKRLDVFVAAVLTIVSAVTFILVFAAMFRDEGLGRSIVRGIQPGRADYAIIRGADCVGWFQ